MDDAPPLRVLPLPVAAEEPDQIAEQAAALLRTLADMIEAGERRDVIVASCDPSGDEWTLATITDLPPFTIAGALSQMLYDLHRQVRDREE